MGRYIDVDIAKNLILNDMARAEREGKDLIGYTDALFHLKTIPIADVVEVVRCESCKRSKIDAFGRMVCIRNGQMVQIEDTNFCSYGERKER